MGTEIEKFQEFPRNLSNRSPEKETEIPGIIQKPPKIIRIIILGEKIVGKIRFKLLNFFPTNLIGKKNNYRF